MAIQPKVKTTAGSKLFISPNLPSAETVVAFRAVTGFVEVGSIVDLGEIIEAFNPVEFQNVGSRKTETLKGTKTAVDCSIQIGRVKGDDGQEALRTAYESDSNVSFKIVYKDGTVFYNYGLVMNNPISFGNSDTITGGTVQIRFNSEKMIEDLDGGFTLTYSATGGVIIGDAVQYVGSGSTGTPVAAFPTNTTTHKFDTWSDAITDNPRTDTNVLADVTVTATFVTV